MNQQKAFLFDLNGTMIDDMHYHIKAWHGILNALGANISLERMKVDHLDIVLCHDIEFVPMQQIVDETLPALRKIV